MAAHAFAKPDVSLAARRLEIVLNLVSKGAIQEAVPLARQLSAEFPNYIPAQVLYADLLALRSGQAHQIWRANLSRALESTHRELGLRQKATTCRPQSNMLPIHVQHLGSHTKKILVIDTAKARLYALAHEQGQVRVVADYYVSVGRLGVGKRLEGDEKTPHGIYAVTRRIEKRQLHDPFFGAGALPINYPNPFDRRLGKTGFGIWFHGSPPNEPSRAVFASNGCIVLADSDMQELLRWTQPYTTPVVIASHIQWVAMPAKQTESAPRPASSRLLWRENGQDVHVQFDAAQLHRFERDMVQYTLVKEGKLQVIDRQGQLKQTL
jgi:lipoprotein-anchoring transpeptidase ErfK/SrfK